MQAITVTNLVIEYRRAFRTPLRAVNGLSFAVDEGEVVGFLGVNGAGKTSTIKTLMGFQSPSSGSVEVLGLPIGNVEARRRVGFLPETALYSPYLTPFETLRLYGELSGLHGANLHTRINDLLQMLGVAGKAKVLNRSLSKGMLQRMGIAQALLAEPRLLIMDEVTSGLDPIGRRDLRRILCEQRAKGVTIFFSSHELGVVEQLCDRILIVDKGKLIAEHSLNALQSGITSLEDYFVELVEEGMDPVREAA